MKTITPEMKAAAEARREKFKGFCRKVADMSDAERRGLLDRVGAVMSCEGRALSETNTMLLVLQCPGVSIVGGFRQWKKAGRFVRKGEKSSSIWIPRGGKAETPALAGSELSRGELVEAAEGSETAGGRRRFLLGSVFDISQTEEIGKGDACGCEIVECAQCEAEFTRAAADGVPPAAAEGSGLALCVAAEVAPVAPGPVSVQAGSSVVVLPLDGVKTIWNDDGRNGPVLICAPPPGHVPSPLPAAPDEVAAAFYALPDGGQLALF